VPKSIVIYNSLASLVFAGAAAAPRRSPTARSAHWRSQRDQLPHLPQAVFRWRGTDGAHEAAPQAGTTATDCRSK
jgi:hypothetical protein